MSEQDILNVIRGDEYRMEALRAARELHLPDWMIGAGFVRNLVWDTLHGYEKPTQLNDIDVIYFDPENLAESHEEEYQQYLQKIMPAPWSVTNQARMHTENNDEPYTSSADALAHWVETATCVAVTLDDNDQLHLIAPHGIADLVGLIVRPVPSLQRDRSIFEERIRQKDWLIKYPKLKVITS